MDILEEVAAWRAAFRPEWGVMFLVDAMADAGRAASEMFRTQRVSKVFYRKPIIRLFGIPYAKNP